MDASAEHLPSLCDSRFVRVPYLGLKSEAIACRCSATIATSSLHLPGNSGTKNSTTPHRVYPGGSLAFALLESPETIR